MFIESVFDEVCAKKYTERRGYVNGYDNMTCNSYMLRQASAKKKLGHPEMS